MNDGVSTFTLMAAAGTLFAAGIASMIVKRHLIKMVMGLEFCGKALSLLFILGGSLAGNSGVSQAMVITLIVIEAVVAGVALALVILLRKAYGTFDGAAISRFSRRGEL